MYDLSDQMIEISKKRLFSTFINNQLPLNDTFLNQEINYDENKLSHILNENCIEISQQNSENLKETQNGSIHIYVSSLVLHLVESPQEMINESFRVLKSGGKVSFSVFGDKERSLFFYAFDSFIEEVNSLKVKKDTKKQFRSKFYLGNKSGKLLLKTMLEMSGFRDITFLTQDVSFGVKDENEALAHFDMPANQASLKGLSKETIDYGKNYVKNVYKKA